MQNKRVCFIEVECIDNGTRRSVSDESSSLSSSAPAPARQLKRLDGLAIRGRVSRKMGSTQSDADVSIANLTQSDIEYLTTFTGPYVKPKVQKKINIYAGYENTGWGRIFSGDIERALPDGQPDVWLNIKAKSLYYSNRIPLSYGVANTTNKELAKSIANNLGLAFEWQATSQKTIDVFNFTGSKAGLIKEFNDLEDVTMFEDNGVIKVVDKISKPPQNGVKLISKDTGMIGIPEPDQYGIKVKCLLDASLKVGGWIKTQSVRLPGTNGIYQIYTLDFDFSSREQQFYCDIYAKASGVL